MGSLTRTWSFVVILLLYFIDHPVQSQNKFDYRPQAKLASTLSYADIREIQSSLAPENLLGQNFDSGDKQCNWHMLAYLGALLQFKGWALQMLDSTGIVFGGILKANHEFLGMYDECLEVNVTTKFANFTGQHCVLEGKLDTTFPGIPEDQALVFFYGMCLPSTCSAENITKGVSWIEKVTKGLITLKAREDLCRTSEPLEPTDGEWGVVAFLGALGGIACLSTLYDIFERFVKNDNKPHPLLASFSLYTNGKALFEVTSNTGQMENINGLRVLSMIWVVFFHCFSIGTGAPTVNVVEAFSASKKPLYSFLINAYLAVDTFLIISGLLVARSFFSAMGRTGSFDVPTSYIHRYLRITPPYAMLLLFHVTIFRYIGDGPIWGMVTKSESSACEEYWWSGLLYVQNFVNPDNLCLVQTWYLSADMQLYWLSPILLYPMYKWPKFAPYILTTVIFAFTFLPFTLAYTNGFAPIPLWDVTGDQNRLDNYPTYSRATPWLVGLALGYLMTQLKTKKITVQIPKLTAFAIWVAAFAVGAASVFGVIAFKDDKDFTDSADAAFYLAFHRLGWSLAISWLIFACTYGLGGPINGFLSWGFFQPMGKLSFGVYLVHISVLLYRMGVMRTNTYFSLNELLFLFLAVYVIAHGVAILLHLLVEAPFMNLDKYLLRRVKILPLPRPKPSKELGRENNQVRL